MTYTAENIDILIVTYNRANMLEETIISLINQTEKGFGITVLDNGSTDNTPERVKKYEQYGVKLNRNETNQGHKGNFDKAQELASKKWVMLFHDDDLVHPDYIKNVVRAINNHPDAAFIGTRHLPTEKPDNSHWENIEKPEVMICRQRDYAALSCLGMQYSFCATVYRTELFKTHKLKWELYSKICDKPFLLDILKNRFAVIFNNNFIQYRVHVGQDSVDYVSGPFARHWYNLMKYYKKCCGSSVLSLHGRIFSMQIYELMTNGYNWVKADHKKYSLKKFISSGILQGIIPITSALMHIAEHNKITRGFAAKQRVKLYKNITETFYKQVKNG